MSVVLLAIAVALALVSVLLVQRRFEALPTDDVDTLTAEAERDRLAAACELQRAVFEVSAELVGCVEEGDARDRFASVLRSWWQASQVELLVWERGTWRALGGGSFAEPPAMTAPVSLGEPGEDLVLDLSAAVDGQAAVIVRGARPQPSLASRPRETWRALAEILRAQLALSLRRVMLVQDLRQLGRLDPLTACFRRWYGFQRLRELCEGGQIVAVAMVDIDHFKAVNDGHGHAAGDTVLRAVGASLRGGLRGGDLVCRWGGEEFLVILPDTSPDAGAAVANRLRAAIAALADLACPVTVSIGVAACRLDESADDLVDRADAALYRAKHGGRNRVVNDEGETSQPTRTLLRTTRRQRRDESSSAD